jgi:hypothetical protein
VLLEPFGTYVEAVHTGNLVSADNVTRIVRLGVSVATSEDVRDKTNLVDARESTPPAWRMSLRASCSARLGENSFRSFNLEVQDDDRRIT